jgi:hypothetical protein
VSNYELTLPWLSSKPVWRVRENSFSARTPWLWRCLTLFGWDRTLRIDSNRRALFLKTRRAWLDTRTVVIPFSRIKSIVYEYSGSAWTELPSETPGPDMTDRLDRFHVGLLLHDEPRPVHLYTFHASAARAAGIVLDWVMDDLEEVEIIGNEEETSREFVRWLRKFLGVPVRSSMHAQVTDALKDQLAPCPQCSRKIMRTAERCVYCGTKRLVNY